MYFLGTFRRKKKDQYVVIDTNTSLRIATRGVGLDLPKMEFLIRKETALKKCLPDMDTIIFEKISVAVMRRQDYRHPTSFVL